MRAIPLGAGMAAALLLSPAAWAQPADVGVRKLTPTYGPITVEASV